MDWEKFPIPKKSRTIQDNTSPDLQRNPMTMKRFFAEAIQKDACQLPSKHRTLEKRFLNGKNTLQTALKRF